MRIHPSCLVLALLPVFITGCSRQIMTPPARVLEFESPKALDKGVTSLEFGGGSEQTLFSAGAFLGTALARRGLGRGWEGSLGLTGYRIIESEEISKPISPWVFGAHVGGKYNPPGCERFLALLGGVGAGTSEAGQIVSGDLGFTAGYENRYIVPYLGGKVMVNVPFGTSPVDLSDPESPPLTTVDEAETTYGAKAFAGVKLQHPDPFPSGLAPSLILEMNLARLIDRDDEHAYLGAFLGFQFAVGR